MALLSLREGDPSRLGRFRLTARLGAGGMGVVYLGEAKDCGRVAVKVVRPEVADDQEFRTRFRREVALLTRVRGMCIARVVEADTESASPYLVTEYAAGPSLSEYVKTGGPLATDMLYGLATGLAEALVAIHAAGVVHRDLKPGNVILTNEGPKVIDFGIAQALDGTVMTQTGVMLGSPGFMAPEQVTGKPGQEADIFAWGLTVAYAASGKQPFGTGPAEVLPYRVVHHAPDIGDVPAALRPLVEAAVAKDPSARPAARDLLEWLTADVTGPQAHAARVRDAREADAHADADADAAERGLTPAQLILSRTWQPPAPPESPPPPPHYARPPHRRPLAILASAAALTAAISAGAAYAINLGKHSAPTTTATSSPAQAQNAAALPTVTFGSFTGREPAVIAMSAAIGGGAIQDIHWTEWTATGAVGVGQSGTPEAGALPTRITLSAPVNGRFTHIGEMTNGKVLLQAYPDNYWPIDASPACTAPTPAQLLAAWNAVPAFVQQSWVSPGVHITGFDTIVCWTAWTVAAAIGHGNGTIVFSQTGGLHPIPEYDLQQFNDAVCNDPTAPEQWKSPDNGAAIC